MERVVKSRLFSRTGEAYVLFKCSHILSDSGIGACGIAAKASANAWGSKLDAVFLKKSPVFCRTTSLEIDETMKLFIEIPYYHFRLSSLDVTGNKWVLLCLIAASGRNQTINSPPASLIRCLDA